MEADERGRLLVLVAAVGDEQGAEEEHAFDVVAAADDGDMEIAEENEEVEREGLELEEGTAGVAAETRTVDAVACSQLVAAVVGQMP